MTPTSATTPADNTLDSDLQRRHAQVFANLHRRGEPLVLPNVWDAASAYLVQQEGAKAIATTSGGCAWSVGASDGGGFTRSDAVAAIARIARAVDLPVTADIERGYGDTIAELQVTIAAVIDAGAIGVNLEDSGGDPLLPPEQQADRIASARETATERGIPLFINARTDVYLFGVGEESTRLDNVVNRARLYAEAGARGLFVPGLLDLDTLATLADAVTLPLNVMTGPGAPSVAELAAAGVSRVSAGTSLAQIAYAAARGAARELLADGTITDVDPPIDYLTLNRALADRPQSAK